MNFDGTNSADLDVKNSAGLTPLSLSMSEELDEVKPFSYALEFAQEVSYYFPKLDLNLSIT